MDARKLIKVFKKLLRSKDDNVNNRSRGIVKVKIYYDDGIIIVIKNRKDIEKGVS